MTWNLLFGSHSPLSTFGRSQVSPGYGAPSPWVSGTSTPLVQSNAGTSIPPIAFLHARAYDGSDSSPISQPSAVVTVCWVSSSVSGSSPGSGGSGGSAVQAPSTAPNRGRARQNVI